MFDDEIWDEDRWEAFLRESDRRMDRRLQLFYRFSADDPRPDADDLEGQQQWYERLRNFFVDNGFGADDGFIRLFSPEDPDELPEWLIDDLSTDEDDEPDDLIEPSLDEIDVYRQSMALSSDVMRWANSLPIDEKDSTLVHFCAAVTQIPANIAKGHALGLDREMLGGYIACAKRALRSANEGLTTLRDLRSVPYMDAAAYHRLYERLFEVRNAVAIHVLDLRERFDLGID